MGGDRGVLLVVAAVVGAVEGEAAQGGELGLDPVQPRAVGRQEDQLGVVGRGSGPHTGVLVRGSPGRSRADSPRNQPFHDVVNAMHASTSDRCRSRPCRPDDHCGMVGADEARTPEGPGTARSANRVHGFGARPVRFGLTPCRVSSSLTSAPHLRAGRSRTATSLRTTSSPHPRHFLSRTTYGFPRSLP